MALYFLHQHCNRLGLADLGEAKLLKMFNRKKLVVAAYTHFESKKEVKVLLLIFSTSRVDWIVRQRYFACIIATQEIVLQSACKACVF